MYRLFNMKMDSQKVPLAVVRSRLDSDEQKHIGRQRQSLRRVSPETVFFYFLITFRQACRPVWFPFIKKNVRSESRFLLCDSSLKKPSNQIVGFVRPDAFCFFSCRLAVADQICRVVIFNAQKLGIEFPPRGFFLFFFFFSSHRFADGRERKSVRRVKKKTHACVVRGWGGRSAAGLHGFGGRAVVVVAAAVAHGLNAGQDLLLVSSQRHADPLEVSGRTQRGGYEVAASSQTRLLSLKKRWYFITSGP